MLPALELYRSHFRHSEVLDAHYAMIGINAVAADTDEEARKLATWHQQTVLNLIRGRPGKLKPPVDSMDDLWTDEERAFVQKQLNYSVTGSRDTIREKLQEILDQTRADEIIASGQIYDHQPVCGRIKFWPKSLELLIEQGDAPFIQY